ncbi:hypothetical protein D9M71_577680 [compost metagenome]
MVAAFVFTPQFALDDGCRVGQQRVAQFAQSPVDPLCLVLAFFSEGIGFVALVGGEQVDGEALVADQHRIGVGAVVGAEQHQCRVHGQGAEGAGGQPDDLAIVIQGGDDGDAGGEGAHDLFVGIGVDHFGYLSGQMAATGSSYVSDGIP